MRAPDAEQVKARCRASLPALFERNALPAPRSVVQDDEGWVNPCFFVDGVVVRFNARDPHEPKHARERAALELAREAGLPAPAVVALDDSLEAAPFSALITERLPGRSLELSWSEVPESRRDELAEETGRLLARLHEIELERFGELPGVDGPREETWRACVARHFDVTLSEALEAGAFDEAECARFQALFEREAPNLDAIAGARLVHRDFHYSNLLHEGGRLTGVLDFEWALAGDPEADLLNANAIAQVSERAKERWLAAYRELRPEGEGDARRRRLYQSLYNAVLCRVAALFLSPEEARQYRAATLRQLERFEAD